jgi:hypothetical protein
MSVGERGWLVIPGRAADPYNRLIGRETRAKEVLTPFDVSARTYRIVTAKRPDFGAVMRASSASRFSTGAEW